MKEEYFKEVISNITKLCQEEREKECSNKNSNELKVEVLFYSASEIEELKDGHIYRENLEKYLYNLTDTTINVICALMDFGRSNMEKVLPINLNKFFNKFYLPYWFNKNTNEDKGIIIEYLVSKKDLDKYLNRAEYLLFFAKDYNIDLEHECGGSLYLDDQNAIEQIDYDIYELHLTCFRCGEGTFKLVSKKFFDRSI